MGRSWGFARKAFVQRQLEARGRSARDERVHRATRHLPGVGQRGRNPEMDAAPSAGARAARCRCASACRRRVGSRRRKQLVHNDYEARRQRSWWTRPIRVDRSRGEDEAPRRPIAILEAGTCARSGDALFRISGLNRSLNRVQVAPARGRRISHDGSKRGSSMPTAEPKGLPPARATAISRKRYAERTGFDVDLSMRDPTGTSSAGHHEVGSVVIQQIFIRYSAWPDPGRTLRTATTSARGTFHGHRESLPDCGAVRSGRHGPETFPRTFHDRSASLSCADSAPAEGGELT